MLSMDDLFKGRHFDREIIILCVRWYLRFKLSFRDLVEMMAERGISLAHTTIMRWIQRYVPEFEKRWNRFAYRAGASWRVDETALVQTFGINATKRSGTLRGSCGENSIPDFWRPVVFDAKLSEFELTFPDPMHEFNAGDGDRGALKALQSEHWTQTKFDRPVILLDQIVQIFRRSYLSPFAAPVFAEDFPRRPMGRLVAIKRDGARQSALALKRPPEKRFGCRDIPLGAE